MTAQPLAAPPFRLTLARGQTLELVPHRPARQRRLGLLAGRFSVPDDFSEESEEINAMFYGDAK